MKALWRMGASYGITDRLLNPKQESRGKETFKRISITEEGIYTGPVSVHSAAESRTPRQFWDENALMS